MSMWMVALGVAIGILAAAVVLTGCVLAVLLVSGLRRVPCGRCGLRFSRVDLINHEELEHHHG